MPNVRRCAIVGCDSHSKRNPDLSFFRFPHQDSPYYEQWRKACHASLSRILPFKMAYICTLHFERGVISGRRLSGQAVPTRFLDVPSYYTADDRITITAENERERRIAYINGVVYEWLLRANRNPELTGAITHGMIKEKAEMAKQIIQCDSFVADNRWLNYFRATHLRDFSKKAAETKPLGTSLSIPDIVKSLQFRFPMSMAAAEDGDDDDMDGDDDDGEVDGEMLDGDADLDADADIDGVDAEIDGADADGDESLNYNEYGESKENSAPPTPSAEQFAQDPLGSIKLRTYKQALDYLKTLEDFAVKKENFRVISIVSQLETLLRKGDRIVNLEVVD